MTNPFPETKKTEQTVKIQIPECCKTGDPDCKHVPVAQQKEKVNIGL